MFCPACRKEIPDQSKVCGYCGQRIPECKTASSPAPAPALKPEKSKEPRTVRSALAPWTLPRPAKWVLCVLVAALVNTILLRLVSVDTFGTFAITSLAGPLAGTVTVILTLITSALFFYDKALYYLVPHLLIVLIVWLAIRFGWTRKWWQVLIAGVIAGIFFAVFSVLSTHLAFPQSGRTFGEFIQAVLGSLLTNLPIQSISFLAAWGLDRLFGKRLGMGKQA